jgi:hypothetical protein
MDAAGDLAERRVRATLIFGRTADAVGLSGSLVETLDSVLATL